MKTLRKLSSGSAKNRPNGRMRSPHLDAFGRLVKLVQPSGKGYEPHTNSEIVREQLKAKVGLQMPTPETRQQRHERAKQTRKVEYHEAVERFQIAAINRRKS